MHLPRHTLSSQVVAPAFVNAQFAPSIDPSLIGYAESSTVAEGDQTRKLSAFPEEVPDNVFNQAPSCHLFACATRSGFLVAQTYPLKVVARRGEPTVHKKSKPSERVI